jgi:hypothetical protein
MVTYSCELISLGGDQRAILAHDFPRRRTVPSEITSNDNALAVFFRLVSFLPLVLECDSDLRFAAPVLS